MTLSVTFVLVATTTTFYLVTCQKCNVNCPTADTEVVCGYEPKAVKYKMFPSKCAMSAYAECYKVAYVQTTIKYCIKQHKTDKKSRKVYGESCPVFCPNHYRPVCGASKYRDYVYRTFNNGCYLDMLNCRGDDEADGYVEVPLQFCQRHAMKNIFKERLVFSGIHNYRDY